MEIEILKNQVVIMKALLLIMPDDLKTAIQARILFTEAMIRGMS